MSSVEKLSGEGWGAVGSWVAEAELQPGDRKCGCFLGTCPLAPRLQHWSPPSTPNEQRWALVQLLKKAVQSVAVPGARPWCRGQEVARLCWPPGPLPSPDQHHCAGATDSRDLPLRHSIFSGVITAFQANIFLNVTRKLLIPYGKALCIFAGQQTNCC